MKSAAVIRTAVLLVILTMMSVTINTVSANADDTAQIVGGIIENELDKSGCDDLGAWLDTALKDDLGVGGEWFAITLYRRGEDLDYTSFAKALDEYVHSKKITSAVSRQKFALMLNTLMPESDFIASTLADSIGKQGIMSLVFGLHLLENGCVSDEFTVEGLVDDILNMRLDDGGWAISGTKSDADVTAMTIQALARYKGDEDIDRAIDGGLEYLSKSQLDDGGWQSYGVPNPESASQVVIAMTSLDLDPFTDERFIKNGNTPLDGILKYKLEDGSFCHEYGKTSNVNATVQVFIAMTAYECYLNGDGAYYDLDEVKIKSDTDEKIEASEVQPSENTNETAKAQGIGYKPIAVGIVILVGVIMCVVLFIKKRGAKSYIAVLVVVCAAILVILVTDFSSPDDYYGSVEKTNVIGSVTMSIYCDKIIGRADHIPSDGIILDNVTFELAQGETVYDILTDAAREYRIQFENDGNSELAYITGIANIYEFEFGDLAGWVYCVNGERPSVGCGEYELSDGDIIEWHYTLDLGNDIGN